MKVDLIKHWATLFTQYLQKPPLEPKLFKWKSQQHFLEHWKMGTGGFYEIYDQSLRSKYSNRLWEGSKHSGKSTMLQFINHNPSFCESMFRDLFNEDKDIGMRLNRFIFHCDQMQAEIKSKFPKSVAHHHDYQLLSVYLSFKYADVHCIFNPDLFAKAGSKIGLRKPPEAYEYERFQKLAKGMGTVLRHMKAIKAAYPFEIGNNLLLVHDFYEFIGESSA